MSRVTRDLLSRARFFLEHAGYCTPPGRVACALSLARAEMRADAEHLQVTWEDDPEPWEAVHADTPRPAYVLNACLQDATGRTLASLCGIGIDETNDPYQRVVEAELASEGFGILDAERDERTTRDAAELAERATYAGGSP
jgi:hypothetical protein